MTESSDNDDLPDLVESSDEDSPVEKKAKKTNGNHCKGCNTISLIVILLGV